MPEPATFYGPRASILITGASSGIGAALAEHLARYGARIALMARRAELLQAVAQRVRAAGGTALVCVGDVSDEAAVRAAQRQIAAEQGPVDVAFLNAGSGSLMPLRRFDAALLKRTFEVNVLGVAYWLHELLPAMLARRSGALVGISSLAALRALPGAAAYGASKAALSYLLDSLRLEACESGVQIATVELGFVRSEMTAKNKFHMPFLLDTPRAAQIIAERVAHGERLIRFPWQISAAMALARALPPTVYEGLSAAWQRRGRRTRRAAAPRS